MGVDPVGQRLRPGRLGEGEARRPSAATKICAMRISPVSRSMTTGTPSLAQSTNSRSPAACVWRIVTDSVFSKDRQSSQNRE